MIEMHLLVYRWGRCQSAVYWLIDDSLRQLFLYLFAPSLFFSLPRLDRRKISGLLLTHACAHAVIRNVFFLSLQLFIMTAQCLWAFKTLVIDYGYAACTLCHFTRDRSIRRIAGDVSGLPGNALRHGVLIPWCRSAFTTPTVYTVLYSVHCTVQCLLRLIGLYTVRCTVHFALVHCSDLSGRLWSTTHTCWSRSMKVPLHQFFSLITFTHHLQRLRKYLSHL